MRISTSLLYQQGIRAMLDQQTRLSQSQLQLATGKRILTPADDPAGATQLLQLDAAISDIAQYQRNADRAESRLQHEDTVLGSAVDLLQRAHELTVRANNDTLSAGERGAVAAEVRQLLDELLSVANTRDSGGEYLFAGFQSRTQPFDHDGSGNFSYAGDQGQRHVQIGAQTQVASGDPGVDVFMRIPGVGQSAFDILHGLATDLEANAPDPAALADIEAAMDNLLLTRTRIGTRLNAIDLQRNANADGLLHTQEIKASIEDLDYAEAVSRFNQTLVGLQAAQQSFLSVQGLSLFDFLA